MAVLPTQEEKAQFVRTGFDEIARRYDLLNDLMTMGLHRQWKRHAIEAARIPTGGMVLDLCSGTGDLAHRAVTRENAPCRAVALDFSANMMMMGRERLQKINQGRIDWIRADAGCLPFSDESFDAAVVGFGLRNVVDLQAALLDVRRVLKPGGMLVSLDTAGTEWRILRPFYTAYMSTVVPLLGWRFSNSKTMYQYLCESAHAFAPPHQLAQSFNEAGFCETGFQYCPRVIGGAALVWGKKPE